MTPPLGIYPRVSRKGDREDDRFHSPREQVERATALVLARGYDPGPVYEDIDVSGAVWPWDRPAMGRLLADFDAGRLGGIAAYSLDRLSREPSHGDALVKHVTKGGGVILTPDIPDAIDSPTGEFTFGMLLQVAKLYRSQAGARFASAKERAILAGIPVGRRPFGYRPISETDRRIEVNPDEAPVVRELYEGWAAGRGRTTLARLLDDATGRKWSRQAVPALVKNRLYATGRLEYGDIVSEWDAGSIVDEALWHAAQRAPAPRRPSRGANGWLLTGLLKCGTCGYNLAPQSTGPDRQYRSYRCARRACPERVHVNAPRIEAWVVLHSFAVGDELAARSQDVDLRPLEEAAADATRRFDQVQAPEAQDALGEAWAATAKARRVERDAALARLGEARQMGATPAAELRLRDVWDDLDAEGRKAALGLFWKAITVHRRTDEGTRVTFTARGPQAEVELDLPQREEEA